MRDINFTQIIAKRPERTAKVATHLKTAIENRVYRQGYDADKQDALDVVLEVIDSDLVKNAVEMEWLHLVSLASDYYAGK